MYFASRAQAGRMLASRLLPKYRYSNTIVLALDDGGVLIGAEIAKKLHCSITLMINSEILLPREPVPVAGITQDGSFSYNTSEYSKADLDELVLENRGYVEMEKLRQLHDLNRIDSSIGPVKKHLLSNHVIIIVSDGMKTAFLIDLLYEFLKPVKIDKLVFAVALASVPVVDRMHVFGDEIFCLDVLEGYMDTNHYYDNNDIPNHEEIERIIKNIVLKWN